MTTLHEAIVSTLVKEIASGAYPPGAVLPKEMALASTYGVSRTAAREAMQKLRSLGMIEVRRRKGATVLPRNEWHLLDPDVLGPAVQHVTDLSFYQSLLEARLAIEPRAAELAAQRATHHDLARISAALDRMAQEAHGTRGAGWPDADLCFHSAIIEASGNWVFKQLIVTVQAALDSSIRLTGSRQTSVETALEQHRNVYDAIRRRQPTEAQAAMTWLLHSTRRDFEELERNWSTSPTDPSATGGTRRQRKPD
ncbi:FadR/GntR family transcriptional regulator [Paraburkholderia xenovorans]|uniref:FadR/GntR family transcriptional regulator n=1 Tax=Paraburkholderia xenovorans TaxID=36873 RepID=UPI0038BA8154